MRRFAATDFALADLVERKTEAVTAILPARETAATIGGVIDQLTPLRAAGLLDRIVVVDADSGDGTAAVAAEHGAEVLCESALMPELGPVLGKGDAMYRALAATDGEIVVFLDTDSHAFDPAFALGVLGPLLTEPSIGFVKAAYDRPFAAGDQVVPHGGGRVNELVARPLLNLCFPDLAVCRQPLAGEVAARRELLEALPFPVGYGVEIANLIDAHAALGSERLAQVEVGLRRNSHQPLRELAPMAYAVIATVLARSDPEAVRQPAGRVLLPERNGVEERSVPLLERAPLRA